MMREGEPGDGWWIVVGRWSVVVGGEPSLVVRR